MSVQTAGKAYLCTVAPTLFNSWALIRLLPFFPGLRRGGSGLQRASNGGQNGGFSRLSQSFSLTSPEGEEVKWQNRLESGQIGQNCFSSSEELHIWNQGEFQAKLCFQRHFQCIGLVDTLCAKFQLIPWTFTDLHPIQPYATQFHVNPQRHINSI